MISSGLGEVNRMLVLLTTQKHHVLAQNIKKKKKIWMTYEEHLQFSVHDPMNVLLQLIWIISCIWRFQRAFITKRRKTWNKSLHFHRVLLLWIKATASFEERRNHNANTDNMWELAASSAQDSCEDLMTFLNATKLWQSLRFPKATAASEETQILKLTVSRTTLWYLPLSNASTVNAPVIQLYQ